jgi:tRNA pseudouridine55 synthase
LTFSPTLYQQLIHETVKQFLGEIDQVPPLFFDKKDGVRLYEHARAGESIEIANRKTPYTNLKLPNCTSN